MKRARWRAALARLAILISIFSTFSIVEYPAHAVAPTVLNVTATNPSGIYGVNDTFTITVQFSQSVFVTDTPTIAMRYATGLNSNASYISGSGTNTLSFLYTAPSGTTTSNLEYFSTTALTGTIKNAGLENATLTLPTPGATGSLSANKQLQFENFASDIVGIKVGTDAHRFNFAWSSQLNRPISVDSFTIISIPPALDSKTAILDAGMAVSGLQIFGNYMYWFSGSAFYRSPITNPSATLLFTHSRAIAGFTRTSSSWVFVDSGRNLYRLSTDGNYTSTFVINLPAIIVDYTDPYSSMYVSKNPGKFLWFTIVSPNVYEIDATTGAYSVYINISKCSNRLRGMLRLDDGSELFGSFPALNIAHRWPDGRLTCSATSRSTYNMGGMVSDGTSLYASVADSGVDDTKFLRYTPYNTTWQPTSTYDPSITTSTITSPALSGGGFVVFKGRMATASATTSLDGKVTFTANGKRIGGCINLATSSKVATCTWKPSVQGALTLRAILTPTDTSYQASISAPFNLAVIRRTATR